MQTFTSTIHIAPADLRTAPAAVVAALSCAEGDATAQDAQPFTKEMLSQIAFAIQAGNEDDTAKVTAFAELLHAYLRGVYPYPARIENVYNEAQTLYEDSHHIFAHPDLESGEMVIAISAYSLSKG